jgi:arsenite methyltransferase
MSVTDPWAAWLLERRHGGDDARLRATLEGVSKFRDRVLDHARIDEGDVVLDLGCGDGLIGFGALARVGATGRVVFSDISQQLLDVCREIAAGDARCSFVLASADELPFDDASVDVVTTSSVLIYVADKRRAIEEAHRVLRPSGRLSIFEPINSYAFPEPDDRFAYYDAGPVRELAAKVKAHYRSVVRDDTLTDFDERDLVAWAEAAGFTEVHPRAANRRCANHGGRGLGRVRELLGQSARAHAPRGDRRLADPGRGRALPQPASSRS